MEPLFLFLHSHHCSPVAMLFWLHSYCCFPIGLPLSLHSPLLSSCCCPFVAVSHLHILIAALPLLHFYCHNLIAACLLLPSRPSHCCSLIATFSLPCSCCYALIAALPSLHSHCCSPITALSLLLSFAAPSLLLSCCCTLIVSHLLPCFHHCTLVAKFLPWS